MISAGLILVCTLTTLSHVAEQGRLSESGITLVRMVDVGQGDGFIVRMPAGQTIAIDLGQWPDKFMTGLGNLIENSFLSFFKIQGFEFLKLQLARLDIIFLTHDDADHAAALPRLVENVTTGIIAVSPKQYTYLDDYGGSILRVGAGSKLLFQSLPESVILSSSSPKTKSPALSTNARALNLPPVLESNNESGANNDNRRDDKSHENGGGFDDANDLHLESDEPIVSILYPPQNIPNINDRSANDDSLIMKLQFGSTSILFTGDASDKVEKKLIESYGTNLHADILKVGHHGSRYSSSPEFLETVDPYLALVSAGIGNRYKHPHPYVIERLGERKIKTLRTDQSKTVDLYIYPGGAVGIDKTYVEL